MATRTYHNGQVYIHSEYTTTAKQKTLPEPVKKAIQGEKYVEPKIESEETPA